MCEFVLLRHAGDQTECLQTQSTPTDTRFITDRLAESHPVLLAEIHYGLLSKKNGRVSNIVLVLHIVFSLSHFLHSAD